MLNISKNGILSMTRGDTVSTELFLNAGTELSPVRYELTGKDKIYLGIMQANEYFETALIKKIYTKENLNENKDVIISFTPDDTKNVLPGNYYYEIKLEKENGEVHTVVDKTLFVIY